MINELEITDSLELKKLNIFPEETTKIFSDEFDMITYIKENIFYVNKQYFVKLLELKNKEYSTDVSFNTYFKDLKSFFGKSNKVTNIYFKEDLGYFVSFQSKINFTELSQIENSNMKDKNFTDRLQDFIIEYKNSDSKTLKFTSVDGIYFNNDIFTFQEFSNLWYISEEESLSMCLIDNEKNSKGLIPNIYLFDRVSKKLPKKQYSKYIRYINEQNYENRVSVTHIQ